MVKGLSAEWTSTEPSATAHRVFKETPLSVVSRLAACRMMIVTRGRSVILPAKSAFLSVEDRPVLLELIVRHGITGKTVGAGLPFKEMVLPTVNNVSGNVDTQRWKQYVFLF